MELIEFYKEEIYKSASAESNNDNDKYNDTKVVAKNGIAGNAIGTGIAAGSMAAGMVGSKLGGKLKGVSEASGIGNKLKEGFKAAKDIKPNEVAGALKNPGEWNSFKHMQAVEIPLSMAVTGGLTYAAYKKDKSKAANRPVVGHDYQQRMEPKIAEYMEDIYKQANIII